MRDEIKYEAILDRYKLGNKIEELIKEYQKKYGIKIDRIDINRNIRGEIKNVKIFPKKGKTSKYTKGDLKCEK